MSLLDEVLIQNRWAILAGLLALWVVRRLLRFLKIRRFPGPWYTAWTGVPNTAGYYTGNMHHWYYEVTNRYGPIARISPTSLLTSDPDVWMRVNTKAGYARARWYFEACRLEYGKDNVFTMCDTKKHDERRKRIAPGYSGRENETVESSVDDRLAEFVTLIRTKYLADPSKPGPGVIMDLSKKVVFFTLDVISTVGTGKPFGMLRWDEDIDGYVRSSEEALHITAAISGLRLNWLMQTPVIGKILMPKPGDGTGFGSMMAKTYARVDERVAEEMAARKADEEAGGHAGDKASKRRRDMLASFIRHNLAGDDLRTEVLESLIAGSDTTAGALRATMLYVMSNKRVCDRLQAEIDAAVRSGLVPEDDPNGEPRVVPVGVAKQLPYLQAVIREGLRVFPPVRNLLPKEIPAGGDTVMIDGKPVFLPAGLDIGLSALAMHHDKKLYGEDAGVFRPERWLTESDPDKLAAMTRVNDLSFGHGKWQCLGKNVAMMELNKALFELFRRFNWAVVNPPKPWRLFNSNGIFVINDLWVQVTAREVKA
ncbi:hypothetical protein VTJ83DRAFT_6077 [Remersonia thermophila]|uniref:Pisatin demethylase n=1 Tax=Remersonia thermophila TaxID=72144 RepID=A0ABR4D8N1_9PEZI